MKATAPQAKIIEKIMEEREEGITTKQRELLKRVVKGFKLEEVLAVLLKEYGCKKLLELISIDKEVGKLLKEARVGDAAEMKLLR